MVDEPLGAEAREQPLGDALLEVQVHVVVGQHARVLEHDRPDRRLAAPVRELLIALAAARGACRASRPSSDRPAARRSSAGNRQTAARRSSSVSASGSAPSSSSEHESASRNGLGLEAGPAARALEQRAAALDLLAQVVLALARRLELLLGDPLALGVEVGLLDLAGERARRRGGGCRRCRRRSMLVVDHLREAAQLALDRLGLAHEHLEHAVLGALREDEVVAADLVGRLELAVDAAVALLDAAGVPGQVEVEQVGAVGLEVQALARGVGGDQDAQRVLRRVGVEAPLDLLRAGPPV